MSKKEYKLVGSSGVVHTVQHGLVDKDGTFFYLLDTGEVKHYRFSTESELINLLTDEVAELRKTVGKMQEVIDNLAKANERCKAKLQELREKSEASNKLVRYVVYEGDAIIAAGTVNECAEQLGVTENSIFKYASQSYASGHNRRRTAVRVGEVDDD